MRLVIGNGGVPPGTYSAKFTGVDDYHHAEYGAGLRWLFEITRGEYVGQSTSRITNTKPTKDNSGGRLLNQMLDRPITPGEEVELDDLVDREYLIEVRETPSGATCVEDVVAVSAAS